MRSAWSAQERLSAFEQGLMNSPFKLTLKTDNSSIFEVWVNDQRAWSRADDGGFPESKGLKCRVRDVITQWRDLGHSDLND